MNTTTHPVAPEKAMAFLDGELPANQMQSVSVHLEECPECAAFAAGLRGVSASLASWTVTAPKLEAKDIKAKSEGLSSSLDWSFSVSARWACVAVGGVAGAVLVAAVFFFGTNRKVAPPTHALKKVMPLDISPVDISPYSSSVRNEIGAGDLPAESIGSAGKVGHGSGAGVGVDRASISLDRQPTPDEQNGVVSEATAESGIPTPMIARTVSLTIMVKEYVAGRASLDTILVRHHSYAAELTANTSENAARSLQASLRVPAAELVATVADLKSLGKVQNESQNGEEVTQQHADLVVRLKNSRETERRLQAILTERTGKISDVLQVEREIARVRGEIEQMEAEQATLEHRVEFATVNLNLSEEYKAQLVSPTSSVSTRMHNALVAGYRNTSETILGFLLFFAEFGLTLLIWLTIIAVPVLLLWRRYRRSLATV